MKKIFLFILLASGTCMLMSSCMQLNFSVTKRHYRSGYHVELSLHKQNVPTPKISETENHTQQVLRDLPGDEKIISSSKEIQETLPPSFVYHPEKKKQTAKHAAANVYASMENASVIREEIKNPHFKMDDVYLPDANNSSKSHSSGPVSFLVILLFAIFIPPLGVALKFGISGKFWISLILTLLFFIPGMIYSIIVVL